MQLEELLAQRLFLLPRAAAAAESAAAAEGGAVVGRCGLWAPAPSGPPVTIAAEEAYIGDAISGHRACGGVRAAAEARAPGPAR